MYLRKIALGVLMSTVSTLGVAADERKEAFGLTDGQFQELFEGSTLPGVNGFESVPDFDKSAFAPNSGFANICDFSHFF